MGVTGRGVAVGRGVLVASTLEGEGLGETVIAAWGVGVTKRPQPVNIDTVMIHQISLDIISTPL